jgi:hypothetical protein
MVLPLLYHSLYFLDVRHLVLVVEEGALSKEGEVLISRLVHEGKPIDVPAPFLLLNNRLLILPEVKPQQLLVDSIIHHLALVGFQKG